MLYVIQTETGKELETVREMKTILDKDAYDEIFTIRYENVLRLKGMYKLERRILFQAYIFVETDNPDKLFWQLKRVVNRTTLISDRDEKGYEFFAVSNVEEELLRQLINENENYIVTLSLVGYNKNNRINRAAGPLKYFINKITEVDKRHRRVFVEMEFLGKPRRLVFGICTKGDGLVPDGMSRLEEEYAESESMLTASNKVVKSKIYDVVRDYNLINIEVGDKVIVREELYGDEPLTIIDINGKKNTVTVEVPLFGRMSKIEMSGMDVEKVREMR